MRRKIAVSDADVEALLDCAQAVEAVFETADDQPRHRRYLRSAKRLRELVARTDRADGHAGYKA